MSANRLGGWLRRRLRTSLRSVVGGCDGGGEGAAVDPPLGAVRLQLKVWEQRL
jgi:hypothetical protein